MLPVVVLVGCVQNSTTVLPTGPTGAGVIDPQGGNAVRVQVEPPQFDVVNGDRFQAEVLAFTSQGQLTSAAYAVTGHISGSCALVDSIDGRLVNMKAKEPGACALNVSVIVSANQAAGQQSVPISVRAAN